MAGSAFHRTPQPEPTHGTGPTGLRAPGVARTTLELNGAVQWSRALATGAPVPIPRVSPATLPTVFVASIYGTRADGYPDAVHGLTHDLGYYWATSPMCALAGHAAQTIPAGAVDLSPDTAPAPIGFLTYEAALAGEACLIPSGFGATTVPVRAIFWSTNPERQTVSITMSAHLTDIVDAYIAAKFPTAKSGMGPSAIPGVTLREHLARTLVRDMVDHGPLKAVASATLDYSGNPAGGLTGTTEDVAVAVAQHLSATWSLMQQPYVETDRSVLADREQQSAAYRHGESAPSVRIVELRRTATDHVDARNDDDRRIVTWSRRWVVSGQWRNQTYGPGQALRRAVYADAFVKAPGNKPSVITPTVHVWRR